MKTVLTLTCLALLLFMSALRAEDASGRVRAVYFEAARGVLVDKSMLRTPAANRWVEVELDAAQPENRRRVLVQLPADLHAGVGDLVGVQLAESKVAGLASQLPNLAVNRITNVREQSQLATPGR